MTKTLLLLFISIFSASHLTYAQEGKILKLPLKIEEGYGPFSGSFGRVGASDTNSKENWHPTDLPAKGFPPKWKNFRYGALETDFLQWTYQNYKQGKLSDSDYIDLQKSWKWTPDENKLSAKPIKCYVHCAWNIDENGHMGDVILDANNNLDFSDDTIFTAQNFKGFDYRNPLKYAKYFEAEKYVDGKIVKLKCPVALTIDPPYIDYSIPIFAKTSFTENKHKYQIAVSCGFGGTDFSYSKIQLVKDYSTKIEDGELITEGEYITIGDKTYKHLGVDANKMTLNLEEVNTKNEIYSKQIGYKAFPFSGKEVNSGEEITLQKYKGKYVFIDFWGTWCAGCAM
ncbi:MAG: redoxin domain-containing protein, partial [Pedobacter sp.]